MPSWKLWGKAADLAGYEWATLNTFKKATLTRIARSMGPAAGRLCGLPFQNFHTQEPHIEETREA